MDLQRRRDRMISLIVEFLRFRPGERHARLYKNARRRGMSAVALYLDELAQQFVEDKLPSRSHDTHVLRLVAREMKLIFDTIVSGARLFD